MTSIGEAIRAERERRGLSQDTVAYRAGTTQRSVRRLETGEALRADTLARVLAALRVRLVVRLEPLT